MKKTVNVYEQAILDICKKARVKSPLDLVGKKIAFYFITEGIMIRIFSRIARVVIADNDRVSIDLAANHNLSGSRVNMSCQNNNSKEWTYCTYNAKGVQESSALIENITFEKKWWQI